MVIGRDDSNRNAVKMAENISAHGLRCTVNGSAKKIDNDLRNAHVEVSFGFDTAVNRYSQSVASLALNAVSARKVYHSVLLMRR